MENAIHRRLESMVPAFEQWAKYEIFSKEEIQKIVKKRKQFEFALSGANSSREGYLEAIDYEMKLNALLQIRWKDVKHKIKCSLKDKSEGITAAEEKKKLPTMPKQHLFSVVARIHSLFERYLKFHSNDFAFWDQYFEFCMKSGSVHKLGSALAKALQLHPEHEPFWLRASIWEFDENKNVDAARIFLERGLRYDAKSLTLWKALFNLEFIVGMNTLSEQESQEGRTSSFSITVAILKKLYENSIKAMLKYVSEDDEVERSKIIMQVRTALESVITKYEETSQDEIAEVALNIRKSIFDS